MVDEENEIKESGEASESARTKVGFPQVPEKKSGFNFKIFIILLIILLAIGGGAWYLFGRSNQEIISDKPTPTEAQNETSEETPTPQEEKIDRTNIKIQILNGTGVSGAAGSLVDDLKKLGYADFKTGNADNYSYKTTQVSFASSVPEAIQKEIKGELAKIYESVEEGTSSPKDYDISIIVGYTKGFSPTPSTKPKVTTAPSGTLTPTRTPTLTPTP